MAKRKSGIVKNGSAKMPSLLIPKVEVEKKLQERIELGRSLHSSEIRSEQELDKYRSENKKWNSYNTEYLSRCFDVQSISESYSNVADWGSLRMNPSLGQLIESFRKGIEKKITELESILERLELIPESSSIAPTQSVSSTKATDINSVFVVHGHDEIAKTNVARFVEKLGLKAVILHEQPNKGQTIIEKFESNAAGVCFAIVLLTPDDLAAPKDTPNDTSLRARQNVVLELGYFCGALGRDKVCVLYKEGVEIPSDYLGVVYTPLDNRDGWHLKLAKEMKEAGLNVDLNDAL